MLYTTYLALPTNAWYNTWITPFNAGPYGPLAEQRDRHQHVRAVLRRDCIFEVSPTQGISQAMNALFQKAIADARISS